LEEEKEGEEIREGEGRSGREGGRREGRRGKGGKEREGKEKFTKQATWSGEFFDFPFATIRLKLEVSCVWRKISRSSTALSSMRSKMVTSWMGSERGKREREEGRRGEGRVGAVLRMGRLEEGRGEGSVRVRAWHGGRGPPSGEKYQGPPRR
jgi:hypothetical protein